MLMLASFTSALVSAVCPLSPTYQWKDSDVLVTSRTSRTLLHDLNYVPSAHEHLASASYTNNRKASFVSFGSSSHCPNIAGSA
jgi:hypothetical protein